MLMMTRKWKNLQKFNKNLLCYRQNGQGVFTMILFLVLALAITAAFIVAPFVVYALYRMDGGKKTLHQFYKGVF